MPSLPELVARARTASCRAHADRRDSARRTTRAAAPESRRRRARCRCRRACSRAQRALLHVGKRAVVREHHVALAANTRTNGCVFWMLATPRVILPDVRDGQPRQDRVFAQEARQRARECAGCCSRNVRAKLPSYSDRPQPSACGPVCPPRSAKPVNEKTTSAGWLATMPSSSHMTAVQLLGSSGHACTGRCESKAGDVAVEQLARAPRSRAVPRPCSGSSALRCQTAPVWPERTRASKDPDSARSRRRPRRAAARPSARGSSDSKRSRARTAGGRLAGLARPAELGVEPVAAQRGRSCARRARTGTPAAGAAGGLAAQTEHGAHQEARRWPACRRSVGPDGSARSSMRR